MLCCLCLQTPASAVSGHSQVMVLSAELRDQSLVREVAGGSAVSVGGMSLAGGRAPRKTAGNRLSGLLEAEEEDEFYQTTYGGFTEARFGLRKEGRWQNAAAPREKAQTKKGVGGM